MTPAPRPHVLIEPGTFDLRNVGDVSMLQVAVRRAREAWPDAAIDVLTGDPAALARHCPETHAVPVAGREAWLADLRPARWRAGMRGVVTSPVARAQAIARQRWPNVYDSLMRGWTRAHGDPGALDAFLTAVSTAALLLVAGQGTVADVGEQQAHDLLVTAGLVLARGRPVALLGQGVGPLTDERLRDLTSATLRRAHLVALREGRHGPAVLDALGVPRSRVVVTGDEAIPLVIDRRTDRLGDALGVHVRWARHAIADPALLAEVSRGIGAALRAHGARAIGLPISQHRVGTDDARTIRALFDEVAPDADAGESCTTPGEIIDRVARCRVVVTGAYHAAVYALAHGVPTVCLGRSDYYLDKFRGLRDLFGDGCAVVALDGADVAARIAAEVDARWRAAEHGRAGLRAEADRQAAAGAAAFARVAPLLPTPVAHVTRSTPLSPALR